MNARTLKYLATLDPEARTTFTAFAAEAEAIARQSGCEYTAISGNRTWAEQDALYAQGRTKPGKVVTNARGGQSNHNFGIALDFGVFRNGKYLDETEPAVAARVHRAVATALAAKHGLEWGGAWKTLQDFPHFEIRTGLSMAEKRARYQSSGSVL